MMKTTAGRTAPMTGLWPILDPPRHCTDNQDPGATKRLVLLWAGCRRLPPDPPKVFSAVSRILSFPSSLCLQNNERRTEPSSQEGQTLALGAPRPETMATPQYRRIRYMYNCFMWEMWETISQMCTHCYGPPRDQGPYSKDIQ